MFFGNRSTLDTATRVDARHEAEVKAWWRDWHRYLTAHTELIETRQAEATQAPSFERSEQAWEERRAAAEQTLKRLPHERRIVFDREREERRATVQAALEAKQRNNGASRTGGLDPEMVERETLADLLAEAEGRAEGQEDGFGFTPFFDRTYNLQVAALLHAPKAAEYSVTPEGMTDRRRLSAFLAVLLLSGVIIIWWTWPRGTEAAREASPRVVQINGQTMEPWAVLGVTVIDAAGVRTTLPVTPTDAIAWPEDAGAVAWWRRTTVTPLELCVPSRLIESATMLEVQAAGDLPTRVYRLLADGAAQRSDLSLSPCGAGQTRRRSGVLENIVPRPDQPLDQPVAIRPDGPAMRVREVTVIGSGQDPLIPVENYRVIVRVTPLPADISWAALDPRLVLENGVDALPSAPITTAQGGDVVEVVYLVPAFATPMEAAWSITDPGSQTEAGWRLTLDPPPRRADVLRDALELRVVGERDLTSGNGVVRLDLRNTGATPLVLTRDDLQLTQGDRTLPVTEPGPEGMTVEPGAVRTLREPLHGIDWTEDLHVAVGGLRFRLRFTPDAER